MTGAPSSSRPSTDRPEPLPPDNEIALSVGDLTILYAESTRLLLYQWVPYLSRGG